MDNKENGISFFKKHDIIWTRIAFFGTAHFLGLCGAYEVISGQCYISTVVFTAVLCCLGLLGITMGSHRLWSHRSFKAKAPLKILFAFFTCVAYQYSAFHWARDHRVHHRYSETDADPHNLNRGFFFAHIGWLLVRKHKKVTEKGKQIDISDLEEDRILMFFHRIHNTIGTFIAFGLPTLTTYYFFGETLRTGFLLSALRFVVGLHLIFSINSFAHRYGPKPYDRNLGASDSSIVNLVTLGEGFHNYHHAFPWDYRSAEFNTCSNISGNLLHFFGKVGWVTDLKIATPEMIRKRALRTGDQSRKFSVGDDY